MRSTPFVVSIVALAACCLPVCQPAEPPTPACGRWDPWEKESSRPPRKKGPRTLFEWAVGKEDGVEENGEGATDEPEEEEPLVSDRPDFTEASSTVGQGVIQLEAGYTFTQDRNGPDRFHSHSYPEALFRIGLFADWFELRIGQNFPNEIATLSEVRGSDHGADDLYLGVKLGLTEQKGVLPEMALILQTFVPTGADAFNGEQLLPGFNLLYSWEVIEDCISVGGSTQVNRAVDDSEHFYVETAQSLTVAYTLTEKLGAYTEWFALFPTSAIDPGTGPEQFFDGGFTYLVTPNLQLDVRAGVGLNDRSDDFFAGSGFVVRY